MADEIKINVKSVSGGNNSFGGTQHVYVGGANQRLLQSLDTLIDVADHLAGTPDIDDARLAEARQALVEQRSSDKELGSIKRALAFFREIAPSAVAGTVATINAAVILENVDFIERLLGA